MKLYMIIKHIKHYIQPYIILIVACIPRLLSDKHDEICLQYTFQI